MFAWGWVYRAFSPFHVRETRNMVPIREFAELVLDTAVRGSQNPSAAAQDGSRDSNRSSTTAKSKDGPTTSRDTTAISSGGSISKDGGGRRIEHEGVTDTSVSGRREREVAEKVGHDEDEQEGVMVGQEVAPPQRAEGGGGRGRSAERAAGKSDLPGNVGLRTALSNMAARESHKAYPGSMVDEVSQPKRFFPVMTSVCSQILRDVLHSGSRNS